METPSHGNQFLFSPPGDLYSAASWFSMDLMSKCSLLWGLFVGSLEKTWVPLPIKFPQEKSGESMTHSTPLAATTEEVSEGIESAAAAKSLQSCPTLCDPIAGSPPGSPVPGILQARTLEWAAISFSNMWKWSVKVKLLSRVRLCATPWTAAYQAPPSMGYSRQECWSGLPSPSPDRISSILT